MAMYNRVDSPGEAASDEIPPRSGGGIATGPADVFDRARAAAREGSYRNRLEEERMIAAVDAAVWERVRPVETLLLDQSERFLAENAERVARSHDLLDELYAIRAQLRDGSDTSELAVRYERVRAAVQVEADYLRRQSGQAQKLRSKLADPLAYSQYLISQMPRSSFRPLDVAAHIR